MLSAVWTEQKHICLREFTKHIFIKSYIHNPKSIISFKCYSQQLSVIAYQNEYVPHVSKQHSHPQTQNGMGAVVCSPCPVPEG